VELVQGEAQERRLHAGGKSLDPHRVEVEIPLRPGVRRGCPHPESNQPAVVRDDPAELDDLRPETEYSVASLSLAPISEASKVKS
jgi:hypothetical protein